MSDTEKYYQELAEKWLSGNITPEEEESFSIWYNQSQDEPLEVPSFIAKDEKAHHDRILQNIKRQFDQSGMQKRNRVIRYAVAACFAFVLLSFVAYFTVNYPNDDQMMNVTGQIDIVPGSNKATLTLSDGSTVSLKDIKEGEIIQQYGTEIIKTSDGLVSYSQVQNRNRSDASKFNTISTPKGGQFQIILPDGTRVWLNAASSLKYPIAFSGKERKVTLQGEGYFEVAKNKEKPFKVKTKEQEITVLGTHFNVNAYVDEPATKTTLLEGAVSIHFKNGRSTNNDIILKVGEQSAISRNNKVSVDKVDIANEVAWKNGIFSFRGSNIQSVMRELSRWYDVEVEFRGELPDIKLWGEMDRNVTALEALEILKYFNLNYKIVKTGMVKKIIIS